MDKDFSMYRCYRGEAENPYFKELWASEVDKSHLPPPECMKYDFILPAEKVQELSWKGKFWFYESIFESNFWPLNTTEWYALGLLPGGDYERPADLNKKQVFELWLGYLFTEKLYPEWGGTVNHDKEAYYSLTAI